eukprot:scaffold9103_cov199-Alexandrium_tamarense.AAC.7
MKEGMMPHYECGDTVSEDSDQFSMVHPSSFRFSPGDEVKINPKKAITSENCPKISAKAGEWIEGTVTSYDLTGGGHRKRVTYRKARMNTLPMPYTDPTQRVFDATQQDCKPKHLFHLAKANKFDFSSTLKTGRAGIDCIAVSDVSVEGTSPTGELESIEGRVPDYITLLA